MSIIFSDQRLVVERKSFISTNELPSIRFGVRSGTESKHRWDFSLTDNWPITALLKQVSHEQCDQIGRFLKVLVTNSILSKVVQIFGDFLVVFRKCHFWNTNCFGYFLSNPWWIFGYFWLQHLVTLAMKHIGRRRWTTIPALSVSYSVHEVKGFLFQLCVHLF